MRKWYPVALVVLAGILSLLVYGHLPARIPMHWDLQGRVTRFGSRAEGAFLTPLIMLGVTLLIPLLPRIDPRRRNYEKFMPTYYLILDAVVTLLFVIHVGVLATALGFHLDMARLVPAGVGVMLVVFGNVLPRVRPNWMVGIRTPWTLSSDRVWVRTHRVGGYLMIAAGLLLVAATVLPLGARASTVTLAVVLLAALAPVVYSYFAWRQENRS